MEDTGCTSGYFQSVLVLHCRLGPFEMSLMEVAISARNEAEHSSIVMPGSTVASCSIGIGHRSGDTGNRRCSHASRRKCLPRTACRGLIDQLFQDVRLTRSMCSAFCSSPTRHARNSISNFIVRTIDKNMLERATQRCPIHTRPLAVVDDRALERERLRFVMSVTKRGVWMEMRSAQWLSRWQQGLLLCCS